MTEDPKKIFVEKLSSMIIGLNFTIPINRFWIFHYTSASALKSILETPKLRFTRWNFLNDESETIHIHKIVKSCLKEQIYSKKFKDLLLSGNDLIEKLRSDERYLNRDNYYILSFSADMDSMPMWSYYTKSRQSDGYSIAFNAKRLLNFFNDCSDVETMLVKLIYKDDEKKIIVNELLDSIHTLYVQMKDDSEREEIVFRCFEYSVDMISKYFKHQSFEYEHEYRIIAKVPYEQEQVIEKDGVFVPYVELDFPKESVELINISPTLSKRNPQIGLRTLLKNNGYDCNIIHSTIPFRNI